MMDIQANRQRRLFTVLFWGGIFALACMLVLQYTKHALPCPLCIVQRYAYTCIALWAALGWISLALPLSRLQQKVASLCQMLILCTSLAGMMAAGRQWWVLHSTASLNCTFDALQPVINHLLPAAWLPFIFKAEGNCDDTVVSLLGLTLPVWSFLVLSAMAVWIVYALSNPRQAQAR